MTALPARRWPRRLSALAALSLAAVHAGSALAALCVWRNPDEDIRAFYGGGTYRTVLVKVGGHKAAIEKAIGTKLDPDETELKFWPVLKEGKRVGTVTTHLGKGDYGAIEVVVALLDQPDGTAKVKALKIQRDRERYRQQLRSDEFLDQFVGKTAKSDLTVGKAVKPAHTKAMKSSQVVSLSVKKMLTAYDTLGISDK